MPDKSTDPVAMWHMLLDQMEKGFNSLAGATVGSEHFSRTLNQVGGASLGAKKTMDELIERYLASMNLPSRAELLNIGERMQAIEGRLNEIAAILHRAFPEPTASGPHGSAGTKPRRTRVPGSEAKS